jgi:hypothetical protein
MTCPMYDATRPAVHGFRCCSPVQAPLVDCGGYISLGRCTVAPFVWRKIVTESYELSQKLAAVLADGDGQEDGDG